MSNSDDDKPGGQSSNKISSKLDHPDQFKNLKNKRSYMKRTFTILENYVKDHNNTAESREQVRHQLCKCKEAMNKFEDHLKEIYNCDNEDSYIEFFSDEDAAGVR